MTNISLLTADERAKLPMVVARRNRFKNIVKMSILNYDKTTSNCICLIGAPGTGKTYLVTETLENLLEEGQIASYKRVPGHITMQSCYNILEECSTPDNGRPRVALFDDTDALAEENTLELLKAAFDSKSNLPSNRKVYYYNKVDGRQGITFNGFGIIIANDELATKKLNVHQQAVMDRVQLMSIDLEQDDSFIYNTYLIEKMLNDNEDDYSDKEISDIVKMFNSEVRKWNKRDAFRKSQVNFSTRLIKKFVDLQRMFGEDWRDYSLFYKKLEAACIIDDISSGVVEEIKSRDKKSIARVIKHNKSNKSKVEPKKDSMGLYINPKTNKAYSIPMQNYYKKLFA